MEDLNIDSLIHWGPTDWLFLYPRRAETLTPTPDRSYSSGDEAFIKFLSFQYEYHRNIVISMCAKKEASWGIGLI